MKCIRQLSTLIRLLHSSHCTPVSNSVLARVHITHIHSTAVLSSPIQKKPANAFARFVKDVYHETSQIEEGAKVTRILAMIANKWKSISDEEKGRYTLAYEEDRSEWLRNFDNSTEEEKEAYKQAIILKREKRVQSKEKKKIYGDTYHDIEPLTVYKYERYTLLSKEFPAMIQEELIKLMTYEWKHLHSPQKKRCEDIAAAIRAKSKESNQPCTLVELYDKCYIPRVRESIRTIIWD